MNKIGIFCSASDDIAPVFMEKARELGAWLGKNHKWLVYGGSNKGLMEAVACEAKANGGMLMGIVPTKLEERGAAAEKRIAFRWISSNKILIFILLYSLESVYLLF